LNERLEALERRIATDLAAIRFPDRKWVVPLEHPTAEHIYDVVVVGAGHCGLTVSFALMRRQITNIVVYDAAPPGKQGPWTTYARMATLRSPKHFNGPDLDIPSLTCESWYSARFGRHAWDGLHKIQKEHWQEYIQWFQRIVGIPVEYETRVEQVHPDIEGVLRVTLSSTTGTRNVLTRKVVFATGVEGSGAWQVPEMIQESLPRDRYSQVAEEIDFGRLAGARIGVLGGGASAYDNAATALEQGARSVDLFFRRPRLHRVNPHKWTEFAGFLDHFRDLPDEWRWRFMVRILPMNEPPPPETFRRAISQPRFHLHLGAPWQQVAFEDDAVIVTADSKSYAFDHVFVAIGLRQDVSLQKELATSEPFIARWADRYTPPSDERNEALAQFPYLGPNFEYVERAPGTAPHLAHIYNFTAAATVSHGPSGSSINGMKQAAQRIATGICRDLFTQSVSRHFAQYESFDEPELDIAWPPASRPVMTV
jgi:cation diffusion facilitator CzcD-associated flavoprotein CzcO